MNLPEMTKMHSRQQEQQSSDGVTVETKQPRQHRTLKTETSGHGILSSHNGTITSSMQQPNFMGSGCSVTGTKRSMYLTQQSQQQGLAQVVSKQVEVR